MYPGWTSPGWTSFRLKKTSYSTSLIYSFPSSLPDVIDYAIILIEIEIVTVNHTGDSWATTTSISAFHFSQIGNNTTFVLCFNQKRYCKKLLLWCVTVTAEVGFVFVIVHRYQGIPSLVSCHLSLKMVFLYTYWHDIIKIT